MSPAATSAARSSFPGVYNNNRNRTFFFWNEEWRRLIQGSTPSVANTIPANDFPIAGAYAHLHPASITRLRPSFPQPPIPRNWLSTQRMA